MSSSGLTSGSAYDMPSSSSRNRCHQFRRRAIKNCEVAVVVRRRLGDHARGAGRERRFLSEQEMIPIDAAGRVGFSAEHSPSGVALAADVIAVLADELVERNTSKSLPGSSPWSAMKLSGIRVACGESLAPTATRFPFKSWMLRMPASDRTKITEVKSQSVSRMQIASARRPSALAMRSHCSHASGEFQAT